MRIVLGGTAGGAGKTSVCLALAASLGKKGVQVRGFKAGPDYFDPMYMRLVTGGICYNLDPWMSSQEHVLGLVSNSKGLALVEGVRGYYDGVDASSSFGSAAHLADLLDSPAVLVVPAREMAKSFGALVSGFVNFEKAGLRIRGIIANYCTSSRHADILSRTLDSSGLPPLVGAVPANAFPKLVSIQQGLKLPDVEELDKDFIDSFVMAAADHLDLDAILSLTREEKNNENSVPADVVKPLKIRIGVARDRAFNFYYQANLDILEKAGAELVFFSPIKDKRMPQNVNMLFLGGGYPELYAYELSQNRSLRRNISTFIRSGGHVYAEGGGLLYLCRDLKVSNGQVFPMVGSLPFKASMLSGKKSQSYVQVRFLSDSLLGETGQSIRGYEYQFSELEPAAEAQGWTDIYQVFDSRNQPRNTQGISWANVLASRVHVYFGHRFDVAERIVQWVQPG